MKTEKNILIAFLLNLTFAAFEFFGGIMTGSVAILSDAIHDFGDAASIGVSFLLEKKSRKQPNASFTYGYARYSVLGSAITTLTLLAGAVLVIYHAILRILTPTPIHYNGMIIFAVVGVCVNLGAALVMRKGDSLNQKAVNLHMLEDALGWVVVLIGAVVMRFTDFVILDPILSIGVAVFIGFHAVRNLHASVNIFLEKAPGNMDAQKIENALLVFPEVLDVHHVHIWSMNGQNNYATMHIVTNAEPHVTKEIIRAKLKELGIYHATLEMETENEHCGARYCQVEQFKPCGCGHHHH